MAPPSQKYAPIGFYLEGGGSPVAQFSMFIRPEDMSRPEPSRLNVNQTLGGAWADAFGRGISTITLSGHQGWRGNGIEAGAELFADLRNTIFVGWHARRETCVKQGQDPSTVLLYYVDVLNNITALVAPQSFTMRRSKTSPLLIRYQAQMLVLDDTNGSVNALDPITAGITDPLRWLSAVTGININVSAIQGFLSKVSSAVQTFQGDVTAFVNTAVSVINVVTNIAQYAQGVFDSTVGAVLQGALSIASAGRNAFYSIAMTATNITDEVKSGLMGIASAFSDIYCSIVNGFNLGQTYTTFDPFLGASNCSSTGGGDPPSFFTVNNQNPFEAYYTATNQSITISTTAQAALNALAADPLTFTSLPTVYAHLSDIAGGVTATTPAAVTAALAGNTSGAGSSTLAASLAATSATSAPSFTKTLTGYRKVETNRGDTLQMVAARELGDASQWAALATLNNLSAPYITDDPTQATAGVVLSGTLLIVPAPPPVPSAVSDPNVVFGTDVALQGTGSGAAWNGLLTADETGDFATLSGVDNLSQALRNVIITEPGDLLFHLPYGCKVYSLLGAGNSPITGQLAASFVSQALQADPRISSVADATATITLDEQSVSATAITTAGKYLPVGIAQLPG